MMKTIQSLEFDAFHEENKLTVGLGDSRKPFQSCSCMACACVDFPCSEMAFCRNVHEQCWQSEARIFQRKKVLGKTLQMGRLLGSGGFGSVYEASLHGHKYAVKKMHKSRKHPRAMHESLEAEKLVLDLKHPNIVRTFAVLENFEDVLIIMEHAGSRNLQSIIDNDNENMSCERRLRFAGDITSALQALHNFSLVHLDLKPANVLVSSQDVCKLGDFGCCQVLYPGAESCESLPPSPTQSPTSRSFLTGTFAYRAPELLKGEPATAKADIYSLGICLWQMLTREQPYGLESQFVVIFGVVANHMRPSLTGIPTDPTCDEQNNINSAAYIELMTKLWQADPTKRPFANEIVDVLHSIRSVKSKK